MAVDFDVTSLHHRHAAHRWERTSVGDLLERMTWSFPDKDAVIGREGAYGDGAFRRLTYRQADQIANQVAHGLLARGLERGDVVMLFCENSIEGYLVKIAAAKAGLVCAPINPMMAPDMLSAMIELVTPKLAVVDAELWPAAEPTFTAHGLKVAITVTIGGGPVPGSVSLTDFIRDQPVTEPGVEIHGDDIWEILFTSGTTALPKAAMISHTCSYMAAYGFALSLTRGLRLESDLRVGTFLPMLYHVGDQPFTVLGLHPGVAKSAVVGLPHPYWGEAVTAVVIRMPGDTTSEADLIAYCRASLAGYETPKSVVFADSLPETVGGKVLKYKLRVSYADHYEGAEAVT